MSGETSGLSKAQLVRTNTATIARTCSVYQLTRVLVMRVSVVEERSGDRVEDRARHSVGSGGSETQGCDVQLGEPRRRTEFRAARMVWTTALRLRPKAEQRDAAVAELAKSGGGRRDVRRADREGPRRARVRVADSTFARFVEYSWTSA